MYKFRNLHNAWNRFLSTHTYIFINTKTNKNTRIYTYIYIHTHIYIIYICAYIFQNYAFAHATHETSPKIRDLVAHWVGSDCKNDVLDAQTRGWAPHASVAFDGTANHRGVYADGKFTHIHIRACRWDLGFALGLWPGFYWPLAGFLALWQGSCLLTPPLCMFVLLKMTLGLFF